MCPKGRITTLAGSVACADCPVGRALGDDATDINRHNEDDDCELCDFGYFGAATGKSECDQCAAPHTTLSKGETACTAWYVNMYKTNTETKKYILAYGGRGGGVKRESGRTKWSDE